MKPFSWKCPFCNQNATITDQSVHEGMTVLSIPNFEGDKELYSYFIVCPNEECKKYSLSVLLFDSSNKFDSTRGRWDRKTGTLRKRWDLIPQSNAKVLPTYVPKAIISDYEEACSIMNLSPKASATLSRRCLQGMIRDFWGIKKGRLVDEIEAIKDKVDSLTWQSIDGVRKIGNIGAHMEKDINLIVDVDPNEAGILLQLIEQLIEDWYVTRHEREKRLNSIISITTEKDNKRKEGKKS
ncbi:DUF4145 domain-containing protein [Reichenbachiella ulvae]|uniref:DUF4145 domain-containing protein n=1 Tax=Reichenbachiella ulvae TaxID=2980104 RepID=A0ABT3CUX9_9BACT|nr:DUF4145 domain-containing protein [Reichenbachiella ulvae]MCV9387043.1 DUF4145 domain-containing protein [Reichenbachiella ulvae]